MADMVPGKPEFKPIEGISVEPTAFQRLFAIKSVWTISFLVFSVALAAALAASAFPQPKQMFVLLVTGAVGGALVAWIVIKALWHIRVRINGGPFHEGDVVQVLCGEHAGEIVRVYEEWPSRNQVRVGLNETAWKDGKDVFSHLQLCKVVDRNDRKAIGQPDH